LFQTPAPATDDILAPGFNAAARSFLDQAAGPFLQQTGDPVAVRQLAPQALANLRQQQASALANFDVFWVLAAVMVPSRRRALGSGPSKVHTTLHGPASEALIRRTEEVVKLTKMLENVKCVGAYHAASGR
jgi:hypothetical protein